MSCLHVESVVESTGQSIGGIIGGEKNMCVSLLKNGNEGCGWSGFGRTLRLRNLFFSAAVVFLFCGLAVAVEIHRPRSGRAGRRCFGWRALGGGGKAMECDVCGAD